MLFKLQLHSYMFYEIQKTNDEKHNFSSPPQNYKLKRNDINAEKNMESIDLKLMLQRNIFSVI